MRPTATYHEVIEVGPLSEDIGHEIRRCLADRYPWMPQLPDDVRLDKIGFVLSHDLRNVKLGETHRSLVPTISGGERLFGTDYRLVLQGLPIASNTDPAQVVGQLTVRNRDGALLLAVPLSLYRYFCVRALVERSLNATGVLCDKSDLRSVSLTGVELEEAFTDYGDTYGRIDVRERVAKDIADYIRFINEHLRKHEFPNLIIGTPKRGFRIDTHPKNIRFIPPPNNSFGETP
jgi:hypothetical protein